jgi:hypothetical protein
MTTIPPTDDPRSGVVNRHPSWCGRAYCSANPLATTGEGYQAGAGGEHRSAPVPLDGLAAAYSARGGPLGAMTITLTRAVAPWPTATYVRLVVDDAEMLAMPVDSARVLLGQLGQLLAAADVDAGEERS